MKVVYIIGPFRAPTPWGVECNVRKAEELALKVAEAGAMPLCSHTMTRHFDKLLTDTFWLEGTLELAKRSDAAIRSDAWPRSSGSQTEVADFESRGSVIFCEDDLINGKFENWVNN